MEPLGLKSKYFEGLSGILEKKGHIFKTWRSRYFILNFKDFTLKYYADVDGMVLKGAYDITHSSVVQLLEQPFDGREYLVSLEAEKINSNSKTVNVPEVLFLCANDSREREKWFEALNDAIRRGFRKIKISLLWQQSFCPFIDMEVTYDNTPIHEKSVLQPSNAIYQPHINWDARSPGNMYSLFLVGIDNPCKEDPLTTPFLNWVVLNIADNALSTGTEILSYCGPAPTYNSGFQRFLFILYAQSRELTNSELDIARKIFSRTMKSKSVIVDFVNRMAFSDPVSIVGFYCSWDSACDELHDRIDYIPPLKYKSPKQIVNHEIRLIQDEIQNKKRELAIDFSLRDVIDVSALLSDISMHSPIIALDIVYSHDWRVENGNELHINNIESEPTVSFISPSEGGRVNSNACTSNIDSSLYTLVLCDPDYPSKVNPVDREYLLWVVVNIRNGDIQTGSHILPYSTVSSNRAVTSSSGGVHRCIFCLYKQFKELTTLEMEESKVYLQNRSCIKSTTWIRSLGFRDVPVAINAFTISV